MSETNERSVASDGSVANRDGRYAEITADMPRWGTLTLLQQLRDNGPAIKCVPMFAVKAMRHAASMIESYQQHDAELETACHQSELDYRAEIERLRLTDAEREAFAGLAAYCDTRSSSQAQRWGSMLRVMLERTK